jgi:homocysteine S-methyltransferase
VSESLADALRRAPVVLDGGLSNQLAAAGHDLSDPLWTARLLRDDPGAIVDAHLAYLAAGASVIITAGYQAPVEWLGRSVELGRAAVARFRTTDPDRPLWIAASVGPYGALLADGSEYRGRYGLSVAELAAFHRPRMAALAEAGPDILAVETVPDVDEAVALVTVATELGLPIWLSYTIAAGRTRAGQSLAEAFRLAEADAVAAIGVNCCAPGEVGNAVRTARTVTGKPVVVYPNSGQEWDAASRDWSGRGSLDRQLAHEWVAAGARLIGGCCGVGPDRIAELAGVTQNDKPPARGRPG